jgi:SAM-dependent methyltransferase
MAKDEQAGSRTPRPAGAPVAGEAWLELLCCPLCKKKLDPIPHCFRCAACSRDFPVVLGIPDLRVYPDPYISMTEDHRKGERLEAHAANTDFAGLVRYYWEITPETPPDLKARFVRHVLSDERRVTSWLAHLPQQLSPGGSCLDLGCGTGSLLKVAAPRFGRVIGCDIAFRWLVVARKRLAEAGLPSNLVCCCADYLPFPAAAFQSIAAISVLEHLPARQEAALQECDRVLSEAGVLWVVSANRFSLTPEPHVQVWGVGFLPRRWMATYVGWRRRLTYDKFRLLSCLELRRVLRRSGLNEVALSSPPVSEADLEGRMTIARVAAALFNFVMRIPIVRALLLLFVPLIQVVARKR